MSTAGVMYSDAMMPMTLPPMSLPPSYQESFACSSDTRLLMLARISAREIVTLRNELSAVTRERDELKRECAKQKHNRTQQNYGHTGTITDPGDAPLVTIRY